MFHFQVKLFEYIHYFYLMFTFMSKCYFDNYIINLMFNKAELLKISESLFSYFMYTNAVVLIHIYQNCISVSTTFYKLN